MSIPPVIRIVAEGGGYVSVLATLFGSIYLDGDFGYTFVRVTGLFTICALAISNGQNSSRGVTAKCDRHTASRGIISLVQEALSFLTIIAAVGAGYLIYICRDDLPGRKYYIVISSVIMFIGMAVTNLIERSKAARC